MDVGCICGCGGVLVDVRVYLWMWGVLMEMGLYW